MRQLAPFVAYPVMVLSAAGVLASFFLALASFGANPETEKAAFRFLFAGIFLVWMPTILFAGNAGLRGCPAWMRTAQWVVTGLAFSAFLVPLLWGSKTGAFSAGFLLFATFYSTSFCVAYSWLHAEKYDAEHRCLNGHQMSPSTKFCEECGAPAAPEGTEQPHSM
jgi:hypothetical protein